MGCGSSFFCQRCKRRIPYHGNMQDAVRSHYWKHHKRTMMKKRQKKKKKLSKAQIERWNFYQRHWKRRK